MDTELTIWPAPAKLNLFLHIIGQRADGYHNLQSLFQLLDYSDSLQIKVDNSSDIRVSANVNDIPLEENIIYKAGKLLQETTGTTKGCHIQLDKKLPMGGGLGGGSSNAATTLIALNQLWDLGLTQTQLQQLGLRLGADVPIFVFGQNAFAEGVGEQLSAVNLPEHYFLVVNPGVHVSTQKVFQHPDLPRNTARIDKETYSFLNSHNDCQKLVCEMYPNIAKTLGWLLQYAPSRMTGTGSCLFSIYNDKKAAEETLKKLPDGCTGFVAKGVNKSPLLDTLKQLKDK
ncbi:4-(cytidine 5'-diphospho)-2-C-methyl-D-erythritol kinase [Alteromonas sp. a30]|uniref:4-(cytidine 5'-diphospho)-2-C-methyl-D-erythritol kinase n=1 Tax=Alteromonas sp. a30 TaxID=2730917 RepID=UPI00227ECE43|nr:4-(cytidine 5'-diphospho)-2-C-methyl-D-erythritol kinase [Alteromonas sp. a30]MCY7296993.1 4-(cytidine 5'-diphospho)-2-C-methyl-D-erythritol kinase [Alteromonas sp. a30]